MSYRIAVSSSDGISIDTAFGQAERFLIYEVSETGITLTETRYLPNSHTEDCNGKGGGCSENSCTNLVSDCKCVICKSFGQKVFKYFEHYGIYAFDIERDIDTALKKITAYLDRVEFHRRSQV